MKIKVSNKVIEVLTPVEAFEKAILSGDDIKSVEIFKDNIIDLNEELFINEVKDEKGVLLHYFNNFKTWNSNCDWGDKSWDIFYNNVMRTSLIIYLDKDKACDEPVEVLAGEAIKKVMEEYK